MKITLNHQEIDVAPPEGAKDREVASELTGTFTLLGERFQLSLIQVDDEGHAVDFPLQTKVDAIAELTEANPPTITLEGLTYVAVIHPESQTRPSPL